METANSSPATMPGLQTSGEKSAANTMKIPTDLRLENERRNQE
jgi:hypothetical protein